MNDSRTTDPRLYTEDEIICFLNWLAVQVKAAGFRRDQLMAAWVLFKGTPGMQE